MLDEGLNGDNVIGDYQSILIDFVYFHKSLTQNSTQGKQKSPELQGFFTSCTSGGT